MKIPNPLKALVFSVALPLLGAAAEVKMENLEYGGWPNCVRLSNGTMELVMTTDVGPRVIRCGFIGGENLFREYEDQTGKTGGEDWRIYGGHRLWHAPEVRPRTYAPDNEAVTLDWDGTTLTLTQPREVWTAVQKEMRVSLAEWGNRVKVTHRITNHNLWEIELSAWAISVMRGGGFAILPRTPYGKHGENLVAAQNISLWRYTNLADPRFTWGEKYILVRTDPESTNPQKVGILNTEGWAAYATGGEVFLKKIEHQADAVYPDLNASSQVYTQGEMIELETLSPLTRIDRGETLEWVEHWSLLRGEVTQDESAIEAFFAPHIRPTEGDQP